MGKPTGPAAPGPSAAAPEPAAQRSLRQRVDAALDSFFEQQLRDLARIDDALGQLVEAAHGLVGAGGKRLRPAFCYWGWRGGGGADGQPIIFAAAALELLHASALVHDDLMDASDTRRGRPSVHRAFAHRHRDAHGHGDPDAFGAAAAILVGDLCLIWADELLSQAGLEPAELARGRPVYDRMRVELMAGQYLDVANQAVGEESLDRALKVAEFKSARYTVSGPLEFGGALAGAAAQVAGVYRRYGISLGEAFQLRDDLLGVFGDPGETGKPAGDDLRQGKRTVLIALALAEGDEECAGQVRSQLGDARMTTGQVDRLRDLIASTGAPALVERMIRDRTDAAVAALDPAVLPAEVAAALADLATAATTRRT